MIENTIENKARFFAQYWDQFVLRYETDTAKNGHAIVNSMSLVSMNDYTYYSYLELTSLSNISDEDAIEVARLSAQTKWDFKVSKKDDHMIHLEYTEKCGIWHHVGITFRYGEIITNFSIDGKSHDTNIGKVVFSASKPVPYIAIIDYLRFKGYALPWMGLSIEDLIEYGWIN